MISRWMIEEAPAAKDSERRVLWVKGTLADVHGLIRKLGAVCGRPKKEKDNPEYNFSLLLHRITPDALRELEAEMRGIAGEPAQSGAAPAASGADSGTAPAKSEPPAPREKTPAPAPGGPFRSADSQDRNAPGTAGSGTAPAAKDAAKPGPVPGKPPSGRGPAQPPSSSFVGSGTAKGPPGSTRAGAPPPSEQSNAESLALSQGPSSGEPREDEGAFVSLFDTPAQAPAQQPSAPGPADAPFAGLGGFTAQPAPAAQGTAQTSEIGRSGPSQTYDSPKFGTGSGAAPGVPGGPSAPGTAGSGAAPAEGGFNISLTPPPEGEKPAQVALPSEPTERPLLGALLPVDPSHTLENLMVGPFNRFAHAAATQVVTGPGHIYNPLFISGPPGSGKSHILHAIGLKLAEQFPSEPVLTTSGARLAQAVATAVQNRRLQEVLDFAGKSKALIIDDFHMTAVAEQNQEGLAQLMKLYLGSNRQVVLGSVYQAKLLGALEGPLGIRLSSGHAVELKLPSGEKQKEISRQSLSRAGLSPDSEDANVFADGMAEDFSRLGLSLRRLRSLSALRKGAGQGFDLKAALTSVLAPEQGSAPSTTEELRTLLVKEGSLPDGIHNAAVLFPKGHEAHADWAWRQLQVVGRSCGWKFPFRRATRKPYDVEPVFGVPFVIAEECRRANVRAAIVVGPPPGTDLAEHERDVRYALEHLLGDMAIGLGWAQCARIKDPKMYTLAYLDMCVPPEAKP